jgi:hypothetical protein
MASFAFFATWGPQTARTPSAFVGAVHSAYIANYLAIATYS